jgi:S-adenosyl-L-methionine hydrolase (adenosine-forming)
VPVRTVCFYSDYGVVDEFAGICRAVIRRVAPRVRVIDITHGIRQRDGVGGAVALRNALPYTPDRAVHLAVVDPGVGGERRAVALRSADDRLFVGPDNGLLILAAEAGGGIVEASWLTNRDLWLTPLSRTFHGRDIFAPVAARLADGLDLDGAGEPISAESLVRLIPPAPRRVAGGIVAVAVQIDSFGNVALNLDAAEVADGLAGIVELETAGRTVLARVGDTFASVAAGDLVVYGDSAGRVAIAVNGGSAAESLGLATGSDVRLRRLGGAAFG